MNQKNNIAAMERLHQEIKKVKVLVQRLETNVIELKLSFSKQEEYKLDEDRWMIIERGHK